MKKRKVLWAAMLAVGTSIHVSGQTLWVVDPMGVTTTTGGSCEVGGSLSTGGSIFVKGGVVDLTMPGSWAPGTEPWRGINAGATYSGLNLLSGYDGNNTGIVLNSKGNTGAPGIVKFISSAPCSAPYCSDIAYTFLNHQEDAPGVHTWPELLSISRNGDISTYGSINMHGLSGDTKHNIATHSGVGGLNILSGSNGGDGSGIVLNATYEPASPGQVGFIANTHKSTTDPSFGNTPAFNFITYDGDDGSSAPGSFTSRLAISNTGYVGVNTTKPGYMLTVNNGALGMTRDADDGLRWILGTSNQFGLNIISGTNWDDGSGMLLNGVNSSTPGQIAFVANTSVASSVSAYDFKTHNGSDWSTRLSIKRDGKVIIGNDIMYNAPGDYNLYVSKGILTEKLKVANSSDLVNWADFVFDHKYELMPLNKVEAYVKANKHLPEIPSAKEVAKDGIDIAEMDAKLLQKIEELTLYVIQQQKEIDELKRRGSK